jgi:perosamine synthetase
MSKQVPFTLPDISDLEIDEVVATLRSGWITTGPRSKKLERRFADYVGAENAVAVNSCTGAMHLALEAVGIGPGDEVIVPTMTFAATGEVVRYLGAKPVLVDVLDHDHNIDPTSIGAAITSNTKAVIPVHFAGQSADMNAIREIAQNHGLAIIEDAAHAFPASYRGEMVGSMGDITCFSFYATKPITTGEGGMAVTDNETWADRMRVMSLHGISKDAWKRYSTEGSWYYEIIAPGFKYNMSDIAAAMGLVQLKRVQEMTARRRVIAETYTRAFADHGLLELPEVDDFAAHSWHLFVLRLQDNALRVERNQLIEQLKGKGVSTSVHFIPLHMHPYYSSTYGYRPEDFPVAYSLYKRSISLPIYSRMTDEDVDYVIASVLDIVSKRRK